MTNREFMETPIYKDIIKRIERLYSMFYFPKSIVDGNIIWEWTNKNVEKQVEQLRELLNYEIEKQCNSNKIGERL